MKSCEISQLSFKEQKAVKEMIQEVSFKYHLGLFKPNLKKSKSYSSNNA